jgi:aldehyde:ferredoxin oxidoreductase
VHERRTAGRCGTGAVMGSKNLKAIAIRGTGDIKVKDIDKMKSITELIYKDVKEVMKEYRRYGTAEIVELANHSGALPTRNFQFGVFECQKNFQDHLLGKKSLRKTSLAGIALLLARRLFPSDGKEKT